MSLLKNKKQGLILKTGSSDHLSPETIIANTTSTVRVTILTTTTATSITNCATTIGRNITSDGGAEVTARGVCWSKSANPTTDLPTKTVDGRGTGVFTSSLNGLSGLTTYYVRAYATNLAGTEYGAQISFETTATGTVTDMKGNIYKTVTIGTQNWMAENLKTTILNNGTLIPEVKDNNAWKALSTPGYCWYNNDPASNKATYGALYNWYTVNTNSLCPEGWHVPTEAEWNTLINFLGGVNVAGGKLKENGTAHWTSPNTGASNESGFTALPGGCRTSDDGIFVYKGTLGHWWSSSEFSGTLSGRYRLDYNTQSIDINANQKIFGHSVRCVMD